MVFCRKVRKTPESCCHLSPASTLQTIEMMRTLLGWKVCYLVDRIEWDVDGRDTVLYSSTGLKAEIQGLPVTCGL